MKKKPYIQRYLFIAKLLEERSLFLFGPRQTGKSTYIREQLTNQPVLIFNLLDQGLFLRLRADPTLVRQEIEARKLTDCLICIDEIQKCPELLDEVHLLIEERDMRFLLTASSARKLKRSGTNLLGGRAADRSMHPFCFMEVRKHGFSLEKAMFCGLLPPHYLSSDPEEDLSSYVNRYLTEEIAAEGMTRNLPSFSRFLQTAATVNTRIINYSNVGNDAQVPRQTVQQWFQILRDTLLGFDLEPYTASVKRKAIETAKFYFFDMGVVRTLRRLPKITATSADFGEFFEHFIFLELKAWIDYRHPRMSLNYWRSTSGFEVDFILDGSIAVEVKAAKTIHDRHMKGLKALSDEDFIERSIVVCNEPRPRLINGVDVMPWEYFLEALWNDEIMPEAWERQLATVILTNAL